MKGIVNILVPAVTVFVTPAFPSFRGNGLAMRAAATLALLSRWGTRAHLLVVPMYAAAREPDPDIARLCKSWAVANDPDEIASAVASRSPDLLVVFRFYLVPFLFRIAASSLSMWLDLDELESTSRARLAAIHAQAGHEAEAARLQGEVATFTELEARHLPAFRRIFTASRAETASVLARCPDADVRTLPNTYPLVCPQPSRAPDGTARFLYVGTFGYYPNVDAMTYFCGDILPRIRARASMPVELAVIGSGLQPAPENPSMPGVHLIGPVPYTTPYYAACDAAIVPLRAAGGTRIKILEAFSHERAVIATSIGAEGLDVVPGVHLHVADDADAFAARCLQVMNDAGERQAMARRGHEFFVAHHSMAALESMLPDLFGEVRLKPASTYP